MHFRTLSDGVQRRGALLANSTNAEGHRERAPATDHEQRSSETGQGDQGGSGRLQSGQQDQGESTHGQTSHVSRRTQCVYALFF